MTAPASQPAWQLASHGVAIQIRSNLVGFPVQTFAESLPAAGPAPVSTGFTYAIEEEHQDAGNDYHVQSDAGWRLWTNCRSDALDGALDHMQLTVAEHAPGKIFVHTGVVAWRGQAILLPGRTFSGKTSLVAALLRRGATYYSDEFAVLDAAGRVQPFARPLEVRSTSGSTVQRCAPSLFQAPVGTLPLRAGLVLFSVYTPSSHWHARRITPGNALLHLLANTVCARSRPAEALRVLRMVAARTPAFYASRGDCSSSVDPILELLIDPDSHS